MKRKEISSKFAEATLHITPRQRQVLNLVVDGNSNREIGRAMGISVRTVEVHRLNLMREMGAHNVAQLLASAVNNNIIPPTLGAKNRNKSASVKSKKAPEITRRETQILFGVAKGLTNREIGRQLDISTRTVEVHRFNTMRKMGARNVAQMLTTAVRNKLLTRTLSARKHKQLASALSAN